MSFQQGKVREREGIYGQRGKKDETFLDGFKSHRSHATAPANAGMTWLSKPA
jgi:hypothetical protein